MIEYAIEGQQIDRICVDYAVTLQTSDGAELRIETAFTLTRDDTPPVEVNPECIGVAATHVLDLIRLRVVWALIEDSGNLELHFDGGRRLMCPPHNDFEAWVLVAANGERIVCLPGGGTAHWMAGQ